MQYEGHNTPLGYILTKANGGAISMMANAVANVCIASKMFHNLTTQLNSLSMHLEQGRIQDFGKRGSG